MDSDTRKIIDEQAAKLPESLRKAIETTDWRDLIKKISLDKNLSTEKLELIEQETMLVIYGFDTLENYIDNLVKETGLPEETAISIAEAANTRIFSEISNKADVVEKELEKTPIVTVLTGKKAVIEQLSQRVQAAKQGGASVKPKVPEIAPEIHPMVKKGEVVHAVPHIEEKAVPLPGETPKSEIAEPEPAPASPSPVTPVPTLQDPGPEINPPLTGEKKAPAHANPHYPGGLDPYREPLL
jgi:hypothetical protein